VVFCTGCTLAETAPLEIIAEETAVVEVAFDFT
jgi:hypothetical protein